MCMQDGVEVHVMQINHESMITALQVCKCVVLYLVRAIIVSVLEWKFWYQKIC